MNHFVYHTVYRFMYAVHRPRYLASRTKNAIAREKEQSQTQNNVLCAQLHRAVRGILEDSFGRRREGE